MRSCGDRRAQRWGTVSSIRLPATAKSVAVGAAIAKSGVAREDMFVTSKVWIQDAGYERTRASFEKTLANLGTDHLDLYLVHMPYGDYHGSWRVMEELLAEGQARAVGVSNFLPDRLADLVLSHDVPPAVNQIELHPFCQQRVSREPMERYGIRAMAWAPLPRGRAAFSTTPSWLR